MGTTIRAVGLTRYFTNTSVTYFATNLTLLHQDRILMDAPLGMKVERPLDGRRLAISDIHGCLFTFIELLDRVNLKKRDQLFILGDLINRGPRSKQVIDHVIQLQERGFQVFVLRGNHEETFLNLCNTKPDHLPMLLRSRNAMDLLNKRKEPRAKAYGFMSALPYYFELDNFILVHAGINRKSPAPFTDRHAMVWKRPFKLKELYQGKQIIVGHQPTPISKILSRIEKHSGSICIDNGCTHAYLGKDYGALICLDLDSGKVIRQKNIDGK